MAVFSKACARDGCAQVITTPAAYLLRRRTYCSKRCHALVRYARGWRPYLALHRPEVQARSLPAAAAAANASRRRKRARLVLEGLGRLGLTPQFTESLTRVQHARMLALLARAYRRGLADGYQRGYQVVRRGGRAEKHAAQVGRIARLPVLYVPMESE